MRPETGGSGAFLRSLPSRIYGQSWLSCDRMYNELMYPDEPTACDTFLDRVAQDVRVMHTYMYVYVCMYVYIYIDTSLRNRSRPFRFKLLPLNVT